MLNRSQALIKGRLLEDSIGLKGSSMVYFEICLFSFLLKDCWERSSTSVTKGLIMGLFERTTISIGTRHFG